MALQSYSFFGKITQQPVKMLRNALRKENATRLKRPVARSLQAECGVAMCMSIRLFHVEHI
jgi:hypothetical protein